MGRNIFNGSVSVAETLHKELKGVDISIILLTPDAFKTFGETGEQAAKDSLLFEMAMSFAYVGRKIQL